MKSIYIALLSSFLLIMSQVVQAHPGHDHSHWLSDSIHMLTIFAVLAVIVSGVVYKKITSRRSSLEKKDMNHDA